MRNTMMRFRTRAFLLSVVAMVTMLGGCDFMSLSTRTKARGSLSITISSGLENASRTVAPTFNMAIATYTITGTGPIGSTAFTTANLSATPAAGASAVIVTKTNLELGTWTVKVQAFNGDSTPVQIGEGTLDIVVAGSDATGTVIVTPMTGTGSVSLTVSWPYAANISSPQISASLVDSSGKVTTSIAFTVASNKVSATATSSTVPIGYQTLNLTLKDGTVDKAVLPPDSIRIIKDTTTTASFAFAAELFQDTVAKPVISLAAGEYASSQSGITLSCSTSGASIYYTNNGSRPSQANGTLYASASPVAVSSTQVLQAVAIKTGCNDSSLARASYTITGSVPVPSFDPPPGIYFSSPVSVKFYCAAPGNATVYTSGTLGSSIANPTASSGNMASTVSITADTTINLIAKVTTTSQISQVTSGTYRITGTIMNPVPSVQAGTFTSTQTLSLSSSTGASIYYTTDGSTPSAINGILYSSAISIDRTITIKAIGVMTDWASSEVVTLAYIISVPVPSFSIPAGTYNVAHEVALDCALSGSEIRYTTDSSTPSLTSGTLYTAGSTIAISKTMTIQMIATKTGCTSSAVQSAAYTMQCSAPVLTPAAGSYPGTSLSVALSCVTPGASVVYTTDGTTTPSETIGSMGSPYAMIASTASNASTASVTIKAIAIKTGWTSSTVSTATFSFGITPTDAAWVTSSTPTISWPAITATGVNGYQIQYSTTSPATTAFTGSSPAPVTVTTNSYAYPSTLTNGTTVYWRYRTKSGTSTYGAWLPAGSGAGSTYSFTKASLVSLTSGTSWTPPLAAAGQPAASGLRVLVVGGGGGGGNGGSYGGGGGGGGTVSYNTTSYATVTAGTAISYSIGSGGAGASAATANGTDGSNTVFGSITSAGGKGGLSLATAGSVGGASGGGNSGGSATNAYAGGGGGGAGTAGSAAIGPNNGSAIIAAFSNLAGASVAGNGGTGFSYASTFDSSSGESGWFGGGGAGADYAGRPQALGGTGGGGAGAVNGSTSLLPAAGTANSGGGGGGGAGSGTSAGQAGGSGIILILYK
ncbi:MAG: chitobiase/beta-hexosaminidase C-terminal domain-containing protein [Spirochaetota bacterium]